MGNMQMPVEKVLIVFEKNDNHTRADDWPDV